MHELVILTLVVVAGMAATTLAVSVIGPALRRLEFLLLAASGLVVLFAMLFVSAEVLMRYAFDAPIPGHLEGSELLIPIIVFLALSYTQATHGHVGMHLVLDMLPGRTRRYAEMGTLLVSIFICSVLAYFSYANTYQLWLYSDVTMSPPYFKTWPSGAAIPLGYTLISIRMYIQFLHLYDPERFPANEPPSTGGFHAVE